jgi:hypothetical protein
VGAYLTLFRTLSISSAFLATGALSLPDPALAQNMGSFLGGVIVGGMMRGGIPQYRGRGGGGGGGGGSGEQDGQSDKGKAQEAAANAVLIWDTVLQQKYNEDSEENRNVSKAITRFVDVLKEQHRILRNGPNANVRASSDIHQVTEGEVKTSVDKAYQEAELTDFDTLAGEIWTGDRLRVQILRQAEKGILPYFKGVGAKGPDMNNLEQVFKEAAANVYANALELSDIVGASRSFDRFIRTIYENSDQAPASLWTVGADIQYERMLTTVINQVDRDYFVANRVDIDNQRYATLGGQLSHRFDFRFRARRALYDCLAASYVGLISSGPGGTINTSSSGGDKRGASIGLFSRQEAKTAKPEVVNVVEAGDSSAQLWKRTEQVVDDRCSGLAMPVAQTAKVSGLKPVSVREDLAVKAGMAIDRSEGQYMKIRTGDPR